MKYFWCRKERFIWGEKKHNDALSEYCCDNDFISISEIINIKNINLKFHHPGKYAHLLEK